MGLLRSELLSSDQLKHHAVDVATSHSVDRRPGKDRLLPRLDENERVLLQAYQVVIAVAASGHRVMQAEAWLLDNYYLIEQQIALARRHLPRGYSRELPRLVGGPSAGYPRIYELALDLIAHQDGRIDRDNAAAFLAAYQTVDPLNLGELWAFPIMLRLGLLENVRRVASRIARRREERDTAIAWADRILTAAGQEPKRLVHVLADFANATVPMTAPFVEDFYARLQAQGPALALVQAWLEHQLSDQGLSAIQLLEASSRSAAADQISIANSVGSLRFISALDWGRFVEDLSLVEQMLRLDPARVYAGQDFLTRDRYRHAVEAITRGSTHSELEVAKAAVILAQEAQAEAGLSDRTAHVGYYLVNKGRQALEQAMDSKVPLMVRLTRVARPLRLFFYLAPMELATVVAVALPFIYIVRPEQGWWWYIFFAIVGLIAASALVVPIMNLLVTLTVPPRALPRLDFSEGIPEAHRTMVVVPTLVGRPEEVPDLLEALEVRYLGNRDPNLFFALLTDFRDAPERTQPGDDELVALARAGIEALNERYSEDRSDVFYLFHRPRVWNPVDRVWMGWERKRGKLEQFNALLLQSLPKAPRRQRARMPPTPSPTSSAIAPSWGPSSTSSPSTPTRSSLGTSRTHSSGTWPIRSTARCTTRRRAGSPTATASCSRGPPSVWRAAPVPGSRACLPARRASTPTRGRSPTSTRTFSARVRSSARASTTWLPSRRPSAGASRRTSSSVTIFSRAGTPARPW